MISRRRAIESIGVVALAYAGRAAGAAGRIEPQIDDDGLFTQPWFMQTFLDLRDDLQEANEAGKSFAVVWEQKDCPYCRQMHTVNFAKPAVHDYIKRHFAVLQLNLTGSREVTDFSGAAMEERELARTWRIKFTPTIQFFAGTKPNADSRANGTGHNVAKHSDRNRTSPEMARVVGYKKPLRFLAMFEFINTEKGEHANFERFYQHKLADMKSRGIDIDAW